MQKTAPFDVLGVIESGFKEKFGIPKQSQLAKALTGKVVFENDENIKQALKGLENFSHIWILYIFHEHANQKKYRTRPPRLDGETSIGVFASRASHRPNPIAMSVVELLKIDYFKNSIELEFRGVDMLHGSWVIDIKPYIKNYDSISEARDGWLGSEKGMTVEILNEAFYKIPEIENKEVLKAEIKSLLKNDPRPAYLKESKRKNEFALTYKGFNVKFMIENNHCSVLEIRKVS